MFSIMFYLEFIILSTHQDIEYKHEIFIRIQKDNIIPMHEFIWYLLTLEMFYIFSIKSCTKTHNYFFSVTKCLIYCNDIFYWLYDYSAIFMNHILKIEIHAYTFINTSHAISKLWAQSGYFWISPCRFDVIMCTKVIKTYTYR